MSTVLRSAIDSANTHPGDPGASALQIMRERRKIVHNAMTEMLTGVQGEHRDLQASEQRDFNKAVALIAEQDERIGELEYQGKREASAAEARIGFSEPPGIGGAFTSSSTYHAGPHSPSFFKDLIHARSGDANAADRLRRNNAENGMETRALGNTNGTGGSGG